MFIDLIVLLQVNDPYLEGLLRQVFHFILMLSSFTIIFLLFKNKKLKRNKIKIFLLIINLYFFIGITVPNCMCNQNDMYVEDEQCESLCKYDLYNTLYFKKYFYGEW